MIRGFKLIRDEDVSGVSGIGVIAEGTVFSSGAVSLMWINTPYPTVTFHPGGVDSVMYVHGHGGKTRLVWEDEGPDPEFSEEDIAFIHDLLSMPGEFVSHGAARKLLSKVRAAMAKVPTQRSIP